MMKQSFFLAAAAMVLLASCTPPFKKVGEGIEYKIISDGKGNVVKAGQFFEIHFDQSYKGNNKDTVLMNSRDFSSQLVALDSQAIPPAYYKIFSQVRKGDSVIVRQLTDSIMKRSQQSPPFMKKGAHIIAHYKIINVYTTREQADSAYKAQMVLAKAKDSVKAIAQLAKDDKTITDFLAKNKIQAVKAPKGTYVQIITPGEGDAIDTSKVVKVMYTGRTLATGKVFDSNVDPKFQHPEAYPVHIGGPQSVITGWLDGLPLLKKGAKAVLFVPSGLAYGAQERSEDIKANENLVFDVEIVDVITTAQAKVEEEAQRKVREAQRQHQMDSVQKAQKAQGAPADH